MAPSERELDQVVGELSTAGWALAALGAALEAGLVDTLDEPRTPEDIGGRTGLSPPLVEAILEVLGALGLVRREDQAFAAEPSLASASGRSGEFVGARVHQAFLQGFDLVERAQRGTLSAGWRHSDPRILRSQGMMSAGLVEGWVDRLIPGLDGLLGRLQRPGARFLDVGSGVAAITIEMCRRFPHLQAVGLDPLPAARAEGSKNVEAAGLGDRIELRSGFVQDLDDRSCFDLVHIPIPFLPVGVMARGLRTAWRALRPGGWALLQAAATSGRELAPSVVRLQCVLFGGEPLPPERAEAMLIEAGYEQVALLPAAPGIPIRFLVGRRPSAAPGEPELIVRDARLDELDEISEVIRRAYQEYIPSPLPDAWKGAWQAYWDDIGNVRARLAFSELIVAEHAGRIVGSVTFYPDYGRAGTNGSSKRWAGFRLLAVLPEARGLGIGRALTLECLRRARRLGAPAVGLHTTDWMHVAQKMYERMGFRRVPEFDFRAVPEVNVMAYQLDLSPENGEDSAG